MQLSYEIFVQFMLSTFSKEAPSKLTYEWLQDRIEKVSLDKNETWYYDQWISTFAILKHRICSAPKKSGLWNHKDLVFDPGRLNGQSFVNEFKI